MTDYKAMTDNQLMAAFYDCSEGAFEELMKRWRPALERYFRRLDWQHVDAEVMANETFMKVYATKHRSSSRYDPEKPFPPWSYTIANRVALDWIRGIKPERQPSPLPSDVAGESQAKGAWQLEGDIAECLDTLDEQERAFVILWEGSLGELSQTEIAKLFGVADSTVNSIKNLALKKLRDCMEGKGYH